MSTRLHIQTDMQPVGIRRTQSVALPGLLLLLTAGLDHEGLGGERGWLMDIPFFGMNPLRNLS